jgi:hypothetical protein
MACLDVCEKSRPPPGFDPRTVQPVASHCTDSAIPVHVNYEIGIEIWKILKVDQIYLESFEIWCWRRIELNSWTDLV